MNQKRKKFIKDNKGFSLVELIIVMAIMAILIGALAPQIIGYVDKAHESKDLMVEDSVFTALQTAVSTTEGATTFSVASLESDNADYLKIKTSFLKLCGYDTDAELTAVLKSDAATASAWQFSYNATSGLVTVKLGGLKAATNN